MQKVSFPGGFWKEAKSAHAKKERASWRQKGNSSSLSIYHLEWKDLFLSTVSRWQTYSLSPES